MHGLFILTFIANVALSLVSLLFLPSRVAVHFRIGGAADNWASSYFNTFFFIGINTFLFLLFYYTPRLIFRLPAKWSNLPNKGYWLRPENRPLTAERVSSFMYQFGSALFLLLLVVQLLAVQANLSHPVKFNEKLFLTALVLFVLYTAHWCIRFFKAFRLPKGLQTP